MIIPDLNIVFTCEDFQLFSEEFNKENFVFIGSSANNDYIKSDEFKKNSSDFIKKNNIDTHFPVIYISMGTLMKGSRKFLEKCIKAFSNKYVTVIISAGKEYEKIKELKRTSNIHIFDKVPQLELLNHADLFITHGGMNSVNEAMFMGVPMYVFPISADQPTNAKLICKYNLGLQGNLNHISVDEILENSYYILKNEKIRKNINSWQQKQIDAGGINKAIEKIEEYIAKVKKI